MTSRSSRVATLMLVSACARSSAETCVKCTTYTGVWLVSISSLEGLLDRRRDVLRDQRDRALGRRDERGRPARTPGEIGLEPRRVAERRRHQQELRLGQLDQRHLPRPAAIGIGVEVELVHHDQADVGAGAFAQRHVGEDLGGRRDDRGVGVDRGVTRDHPDVVGAEDLAEVEELLADEGLDRCGVDAALAASQRGGHRRGRHEALAGAGRRRQDHVGAGDALQDRLVLGGIEGETPVVDPLRDRVVDDVLVRRHALRQQVDQPHQAVFPTGRPMRRHSSERAADHDGTECPADQHVAQPVTAEVDHRGSGDEAPDRPEDTDRPAGRLRGPLRDHQHRDEDRRRQHGVGRRHRGAVERRQGQVGRWPRPVDPMLQVAVDDDHREEGERRQAAGPPTSCGPPGPADRPPRGPRGTPSTRRRPRAPGTPSSARCSGDRRTSAPLRRRRMRACAKSTDRIGC